jgi:predicted GNAT family N-acyltransferase
MSCPVNSLDKVRIRLAVWEADSAAIRAVRNTVFSVEQGISESLDFDGRDHQCTHVLALLADGECIGTARMLPDGHVGRIAVDRQWRGRGVGTQLVKYLSDVARDRGFSEIYLHSQVQAADFYTRLGFETRGETFMEAGIEHVLMVRVF